MRTHLASLEMKKSLNIISSHAKHGAQDHYSFFIFGSKNKHPNSGCIVDNIQYKKESDRIERGKHGQQHMVPTLQGKSNPFF